MSNIPFDGGPGIPITPKGSVEEARRAALTVCRIARSDTAAARTVLDALGLTDTLVEDLEVTYCGCGHDLSKHTNTVLADGARCFGVHCGCARSYDDVVLIQWPDAAFGGVL